MNATRAGPDTLARLIETIRQLRLVPHVREKRPGEFHLQDRVFVAFFEDDGRPYAELRRASGTAVDRFALDDASLCRRLVDEAKRRAAKVTDE